MGNQNSEINNEQFSPANWEELEKLPDYQVWRNRIEPHQSLQQYNIFTQNDTEFNYQKKAFDLRNHSPLLVSAYYFTSYPKDNFCSFARKHSLYLQRIPIRLEDIEHVPYPDYLHLFDATLKGFAQLARWVGHFPIDQGMVGINEYGIVKVWLNANLSAARPFGKATEAQMVSSLIEAIDRNIDQDQLPPSIPTVRNFLYKNSDILSFDAAIWEFGQFVRRFNFGQVPIRLECIDYAGGVYAIANRPQDGSHLKKSDVRRSQIKANNVASFKHPSVLTTIPASSDRVFSQLPIINQQNSQIYSQNQLISDRPSSSYTPIPIAQPLIPIVQPNTQIIEVPTAIINNGSVAQPQWIGSRKSIDTYVHRVANAPKFTVEVIPGKVIPQTKSSTIYLKSSKYIPPENQKNGSTKQISLLEQIHPRFATSQKEVNDFPQKINQTVKEVDPIIIQSKPKQDQVVESGPNSKRSIPQVVLEQQESVQEKGTFPISHPDPTLQYFSKQQFNDTESIPHDSASNSLAMTFNPAYERQHITEVQFNNSQQFPRHQNQSLRYDLLQQELPSQTDHFLEKLNGGPIKIVDWEAENNNQNEEQVRVTGKFNLFGSERGSRPEYEKLENLYYDHSGFQQLNNYLQQPQPINADQQRKFYKKAPQNNQTQSYLQYFKNYSTEQPHIDPHRSYQTTQDLAQLSSSNPQYGFFPDHSQ